VGGGSAPLGEKRKDAVRERGRKDTKNSGKVHQGKVRALIAAANCGEKMKRGKFLEKS